MKNSIVVLIFCILLTVDCKATKVDTENFDQLESCKNSVFYKNIKSYISNYYIGIDDNVFFYCIYFFEKDSVDYFTIWVQHTEPDFKFKNVDLNIDYYIVENLEGLINNKRNTNQILLIVPKNRSLPEIVTPCRDRIKAISLNDIVQKNHFVYDGSQHPETYEYAFFNNQWNIELKDTVLMDFMGEDGIRFEKMWDERYEKRGIIRRYKKEGKSIRTNLRSQ